MRVIAALAFVILAGALAIAALHGAGQSPNTSTPSQSTTTAQDTSFLESGQRYNLAEQSFGQIAQDRGQSAATTELATTTNSEHNAAEAKFTSLANQLGVTLPTSPSSAQEAQADQLRSVASSSFDLAYAQNQVTGHQQSITNTQQEISHGTNPDVVSYARTYLSLEQSHLQEAQANLNALNGTGGETGGGGTPTAVPGGSPSAVPAGTGGLAARHEGYQEAVKEWDARRPVHSWRCAVATTRSGCAAECQYRWRRRAPSREWPWPVSPRPAA